MGYLEICSLRDEAQVALGDDFDLKEFHRFLLETGPASFDLIRERMDAWIADQQAEAETDALAA